MLVSLDEYLDTADSPDREYVDGAIVERQVGERPHSLAQKNSVIYLRTPAGGPTAKKVSDSARADSNRSRLSLS